MTHLSALLLGLLQGFTELFPISSSGHLAIAQHLWQLGIPRELLGFDILLHTGSLCALVVCYPRTWWRLASAPFTLDKASLRLLFLLILATIPAAIAGVFLKDIVEEAAGTPHFIAASFAITGLVLIIAERLPQKREVQHLGIIDALVIGIAQACALPPGLSRSGLTISAGRLRGLSRRTAVDFSFLMAAPIIIGATLVTAKDFFTGGTTLPPLSISSVGFLASFIASIGAIFFVQHFIRTRSLAWFALYLIPFAGILLLAS